MVAALSALPGYKIIEEIHQSANTLVYRGLDSQDTPVVLKMLNGPHPTPAACARFEREFEILQQLDCPNVVTALALTRYQNSPVLVMEDFGAQSLAQWLKTRPSDLPAFLEIAVYLARALEAVHAQGIVHKDINPSNILINPDTEVVKLADFGIASLLSRETPTLLNLNLLEGTLLYMSPEQTGRMNRVVDYRTDFYSLGATFYLMLTGRLPFNIADPMELVHHHIARQPVPPTVMRPNVPRAVSDIVMKLMAKTAEERYQSASGLLADLQACLHCLQGSQSLDDFTVGLLDSRPIFQIPQRLYGREHETLTLLGGLEQAAQGNGPFLVVMGYSGIGKSALIHEIHKPLIQRQGYFVSGKFDQYLRNLPYGALIQAFRELLRQILSESEAQIQRWQERLQAALGNNGQVIADVLPELEWVLGKQLPVPALGANETRNRFVAVFQAFLDVFAQPEHPLVLFLDDLQWADSPTLDLIETLAARSNQSHLLLIGAYRDNEVDTTHPLMQTLRVLQDASRPPITIQLGPLSKQDVQRFVADALQRSVEEVDDLGDLVTARTLGNPFFVTQFLRALHEKGLIRFDPHHRCWDYDLESIRTLPGTDNVIDLMLAKLRALPHATQQVLQKAACIGNTFDLRTLAAIHNDDYVATGRSLWEAVREEMVLPLSQSGRHSWHVPERGESPALADVPVFKFLHDRVQQAAYLLIPEAERAPLHLQIGRYLLETSGPGVREQNVFAILNQINPHVALITSPVERITIAGLNLLAGRKAKASTAYQPALDYVTVGCELLSEQAWQTTPDLMRDLATERADLAHLCGDRPQAETYFGMALAHARTTLDKAQIYEKKIHFYTNMGDFAAAYAAGRSALQLYGITLPLARSAKPRLVAEFIRAKIRLRGRATEELLHRPDMTDAEMRNAVRLIAGVLKAAYQVAPELCVANAIKMVNLTLRHGNMEDNALGFIVFGPIFLGGVRHDYQAAYDIGNLALDLVDKYHNYRIKSEVNFVYGYFANSWTKPAAETETFFRTAYQTGREYGDYFHASCAACVTVQSQLLRGVSLDQVKETARPYLEFVSGIHNRDATGVIRSALRAVANLQGETESRDSFNGDGFEETAFEAELRAFGSQHFAHFYYINKMQTLLLWGEYEQAARIAQTSERFLSGSIGMLHAAEHHYLHGLILCGLPAAEPHAEGTRGRKIRRQARMLSQWAARCPANFLHKSLLLQAEQARREGQATQAAERYSQAIQAAREYGALGTEALANELAAKHHAAAHNETLAQNYLQEARTAYKHWGASAKVQALEAAHPALSVQLRPEVTIQTTTTTSGNTSQVLDTLTVVKACGALSGEIFLPNLLRRLLALVMENAGATRALLLLADQDTLTIEATSALDGPAEPNVASLPLDQADNLSHNVVHYVARTQETVVIYDARQERATTRDLYLQTAATRSLLCAPLLHQGQLVGLLYLENDLVPGAFTSDRLDVLNLLCAQAAISIENARLVARLETTNAQLADTNRALEHQSTSLLRTNSAYSRFVPREFLRLLDRTDILDVRLGDQVQKDITCLFTDIRSFTSLSETLSPKENFDFLNSVLHAIVPIIRAHRGYVDKYIGDGLLALFPETPADALDAAIAMRRRLVAYNASRHANGQTPIEMGVGIHTGTLILGIIGDDERMEGTVIADAVNLASRLENLTKRYGVPILLSQAVVNALPDPARYNLRAIDHVRVQGRTMSVTLHEMLDGQPFALAAKKTQTGATFQHGLACFHRHEKEEALACFREVLALNPDDTVAQLYVRRCLPTIEDSTAEPGSDNPDIKN